MLWERTKTGQGPRLKKYTWMYIVDLPIEIYLTIFPFSFHSKYQMIVFFAEHFEIKLKKKRPFWWLVTLCELQLQILQKRWENVKTADFRLRFKSMSVLIASEQSNLVKGIDNNKPIRTLCLHMSFCQYITHLL